MAKINVVTHKNYRATSADNLQKEQPRIPLVATFEALKWQGRAMVKLHINYEQVELYAGCTVSSLRLTNSWLRYMHCVFIQWISCR